MPIINATGVGLPTYSRLLLTTSSSKNVQIYFDTSSVTPANNQKPGFFFIQDCTDNYSNSNYVRIEVGVTNSYISCKAIAEELRSSTYADYVYSYDGTNALYFGMRRNSTDKPYLVSPLYIDGKEIYPTTIDTVSGGYNVPVIVDCRPAMTASTKTVLNKTHHVLFYKFLNIYDNKTSYTDNILITYTDEEGTSKRVNARILVAPREDNTTPQVAFDAPNFFDAYIDTYYEGVGIFSNDPRYKITAVYYNSPAYALDMLTYYGNITSALVLLPHTNNTQQALDLSNCNPYPDQLVQYIGESTADYTFGCFYKSNQEYVETVAPQLYFTQNPSSGSVAIADQNKFIAWLKSLTTEVLSYDTLTCTYYTNSTNPYIYIQHSSSPYLSTSYVYRTATGSYKSWDDIGLSISTAPSNNTKFKIYYKKHTVKLESTWVKQDISDPTQFSTMPLEASIVGKIVQYIGTTDQNYTNGYFYKGIITSTTPSSATLTLAQYYTGATATINVATFENAVRNSYSLSQSQKTAILSGTATLKVYVYKQEYIEDWGEGEPFTWYDDMSYLIVDGDSIQVGYLDAYGIEVSPENANDVAFDMTYTPEAHTYGWTQLNVQPADALGPKPADVDPQTIQDSRSLFMTYGDYPLSYNLDTVSATPAPDEYVYSGGKPVPGICVPTDYGSKDCFIPYIGWLQVSRYDANEDKVYYKANGIEIPTIYGAKGT